MSQGDPSPHPGHPAVWAGSGLVLRSHQARGAVCCPRVGLAALEGDAILVWCETAGLRGLALAQGWIPWLQQASLPSLTMASQRGQERATRGGLGPGDLGLKILKGKSLGLKPEGTEI